MANKRFPADMADITADYTQLLAVKDDGTVGTASPCLARSGGSLTGTVLINYDGRTIDAIGSSVQFSNIGGSHDIIFGDGNVRYFSLHTPLGASTGSIRNFSAGTNILTWDTSGNIVVTGTVTAQGTVLTSAREKKHVAGLFEEDALSQINSLKLHKFSYRKFETNVLEPEKIDKKGKIVKEAVTEEVELPATEPEHIGLMYDEVVDNPNIATKEGSIKLHNLVFLQARAIQQLTERIQQLEAKGKK